MKVKDIPYIRLFTKLFDYKSEDSNKVFTSDSLLLFFVNILIFFFLNRFQAYFSPFSIILAISLLALFFAQFLSLCARRLNDIGAPKLLCLLSFTIIGIIFLTILLFCSPSNKSCDIRGNSSINEKTKNTPYVFAGSITLITSVMLLFVSAGLIIVRDVACDKIIGPTIWTLDRNTNHYNNRIDSTKNANAVMPQLSEIGDYKSVNFAYQHSVQSLFMGFESRSISLFAFYGDDYEAQKESTNEKYESLYLQEERGGFILCNFEYKGYDLRIVPDLTYWVNKDGEGLPTVKSFMMVGFNNSKKAIAYFYYYDFDLDTISIEGEEDGATHELKLGEMRSFLKTYFYWY